jgi:hypothetical protein
MDWFLRATDELQNVILSGEGELHEVVMPSLCFACILVASKRTIAADLAAHHYQESANAGLQAY